MLENATGLVIRNNIIRAYRPINAVNSNMLRIVNNVLTNKLWLTTANSPWIINMTNTPNSMIINNVFYDPLRQSIYLDSGSRQGVMIGYNCVYRSDGRPPQGAPYPNDLWNINPLFVNPAARNFHLQARSPLINRGATLGLVRNDYDGNPRPQGIASDIGAYEYLFGAQP